MTQNKPNRTVALYLRISTVDQSTELQRRELLAFVESRGWEVHSIYEDKATGTNDKRPQLQALLRDARERKFDVVLCWKLDRFFRSLKGMVVTLQEFEELGVEFVSLKDQLDLTTSAGRLMTHILAAFAEFEAGIIRERVRAGIANARAKGKKLGRPYQIDAAKARALRAEGLSLSEIAKRLGSTKSGVSKTLRRRVAQVE